MGSVSVFVPCYKYGHFLRQCVESILSQAGVDVRVLILDDASPDDTPEVAAELVGRDSRVEYRRHDVNKGHIRTFNEGIDWSDGDYNVLLSADDLLAPGALSRAARLLDDHPEVGLAYGRGIVLGAGEPQPRSSAEADHRWKLTKGIEFLESCCSEGGNPVCTPTAIVRTRLQRELGGYRTELPHSGDMEMWLRFASHADVAYIDADQAYYRVHDANMSHRWFSEILGDLGQRKAAFDHLFRRQSASIADAERLRLAADLAVSMEAFWAASRMFDEGDPSSCRELLAFALEVHPGLRDRPEYGRLLWKKRIGFRAWSSIRPALSYWRNRHARRSPYPTDRASRSAETLPHG